MSFESETPTPPLDPCQRCKVPYRLIGIEDTDKPHHHLYTFECDTCGDRETRTVRAQQLGSRGGLVEYVGSP